MCDRWGEEIFTSVRTRISRTRISSARISWKRISRTRISRIKISREIFTSVVHFYDR